MARNLSLHLLLRLVCPRCTLYTCNQYCPPDGSPPPPNIKSTMLRMSTPPVPPKAKKRAGPKPPPASTGYQAGDGTKIRRMHSINQKKRRKKKAHAAHPDHTGSRARSARVHVECVPGNHHACPNLPPNAKPPNFVPAPCYAVVCESHDWKIKTLPPPPPSPVFVS